MPIFGMIAQTAASFYAQARFSKKSPTFPEEYKFPDFCRLVNTLFPHKWRTKHTRRYRQMNANKCLSGYFAVSEKCTLFTNGDYVTSAVIFVHPLATTEPFWWKPKVYNSPHRKISACKRLPPLLRGAQYAWELHASVRVAASWRFGDGCSFHHLSANAENTTVPLRSPLTAVSGRYKYSKTSLIWTQLFQDPAKFETFL